MDSCSGGVGGDALQDLQDLFSVATLAKQGDGKVQGHGVVGLGVEGRASLGRTRSQGNQSSVIMSVIS